MYDAITAAVDFSDAIAALGLICAALALVAAARRGYALVLSMIDGGGDDDYDAAQSRAKLEYAESRGLLRRFGDDKD